MSRKLGPSSHGAPRSSSRQIESARIESGRIAADEGKPHVYAPVHITSRDNPLLVGLRRLVRDPAGYRKDGAIWLEGEHLCEASVARGKVPVQALITERAWDVPKLRALAERAKRVAILPEPLFKSISSLESHGEVGFLIEYAPSDEVEAGVRTVVLDRLQDAGNVGTILRSAAALGIAQVLALKGTAALWSPKVLRSAMGAHFALHLVESLDIEQLGTLEIPWLATSSHAESSLTDAALPDPCAWIVGHEGQGVAAELIERCQLTLRIPQPGGEESLNVASAASICLYESLRQRQ